MSNFQAAAGAQGRAFEDVVALNLEIWGWHIVGRRWHEPVTLVEVDLVAVDPNGESWWIECKGSWLSGSNRNGSKRTDTAKKAIANAALLSTVPDARPRLLATSHLPELGSSAHRWIERAKAQGWITRVEVVSTFASVINTVRSVRPVSGETLFDGGAA